MLGKSKIKQTFWLRGLQTLDRTWVCNFFLDSFVELILYRLSNENVRFNWLACSDIVGVAGSVNGHRLLSLVSSSGIVNLTIDLWKFTDLFLEFMKNFKFDSVAFDLTV